MDFISGTNRNQVILFPESVEDYITEDNPVRFIDAFVASLDLAELGFRRAQPAETGRPAYDPADLLRLYLYGYLNRVRSSRMRFVMRRRYLAPRGITQNSAVAMLSFLRCASRIPMRLDAIPY